MTCLTLSFLHNVYESDSKRKSHLLQISLLKWRTILLLRLHHRVKIRRQNEKMLKYLWKLLGLYPGILFVMNSRYFPPPNFFFNLILQRAKLTWAYNKAELLNTWNTQTVFIKDSAQHLHPCRRTRTGHPLMDLVHYEEVSSYIPSFVAQNTVFIEYHEHHIVSWKNCHV